MKNLRLFQTQTAYVSEEENLVIPNVSYVRETKKVYFRPKKQEPVKILRHMTNIITQEMVDNGEMHNVRLTPFSTFIVNGEEQTKAPTKSKSISYDGGTVLTTDENYGAFNNIPVDESQMFTVEDGMNLSFAVDDGIDENTFFIIAFNIENEEMAEAFGLPVGIWGGTPYGYDEIDYIVFELIEAKELVGLRHYTVIACKYDEDSDSYIMCPCTTTCDNANVLYQYPMDRPGTYEIDFDFKNAITSISQYALFGSVLTSLSDNALDGIERLDEYAFNDYYTLTSLTIPDSMVYIGSDVFFNCKNLAIINYNGTVEQWENLEKGEWWDEGLGWKTIHCTDGDVSRPILYIYTYENGSVIEYVSIDFIDNEGVISVNITSAVTNIENWMFSNYTSLTSITIPNSVTEIGEWAFNNCENLSDIYYNGTVDQWHAITKLDYWSEGINSECVVHCADDNIPLFGPV